jgi:hypothetical protein
LRRLTCLSSEGLATVIVIAMALLFSSLPAAAQGQSPPFTSRPEEELLLLAVRLDRSVLTDTLVAYPLEGTIIVPFGELMRLLDLAIAVDVVNGRASGFFIQENRTFNLDVDSATVTVEGRMSSFDPARIEVHQDDIYVDIDLVRQWLPLDITTNLYASLLTITPREPLPMQLRAEREKRIQRGLSSVAKGPDYPMADSPYLLIGGPFIDTSAVFERRPGPLGTTNQLRHATYLSGDLLYGEASAFLSGSDDGPLEDHRFSWARRDPGATLFGPLGATELVLGEASFPGVELVARAATGTGFLLTNYPLDRLNQFDQHTFRGELPPGWDVELYRNGAILDFQRSRPDGLYEFLDVPVLFGMNIFRLVFYGPQGQRREETQTFNVGQSLIPPGELRYRFAHADPRGLSTRSLAQFEYGLSSASSIEISLSQVGEESEERRFATGRLFASRDRWLGQFDFIKNDDGGTFLGAGATTQVGNLGLSLRYADLDDFSSEDLPPRFGPIDSYGELRLSGVLGSPKRLTLPFFLNVERNGLAEGGAAYIVSNSISGFAYGVAGTNRLQGTWFSGVTRPGLRSFVNGSFILSRWFQENLVRGEVGYGIEPDLDATYVQVQYETRRFEDYVLSAGIIRNMILSETRLLAGASKRAGLFGLTLNLEYGDQGLGVRAILNVGAGWDRRASDWFTSARRVASSGAASVLVFMDDDGDGKMGPDESPIPGATFFINRASSRIETDDQGEARFTGLSPHRPTDIAISESSLEDPYLQPTAAGYRFVPRPGNIPRFLFPVRMTGEITGTTWIVRGGQLVEAAGLELQLIDESGAVAFEVRSEYDGFYTIPSVLPGEYVLRVSASQLLRLGATAEEKVVVIGPEGSVRDGVDVTVRPVENGSLQ